MYMNLFSQEKFQDQLNDQLLDITGLSSEEIHYGYIHLAEQYHSEGKIKESFRCYQELLEHRPQFIKGFFHHAIKLGWQVRDDEAKLREFIELYTGSREQLKKFVKCEGSVQNIYHCSVPKAATQWIRNILVDFRTHAYSNLIPFPVELMKDVNAIPLHTMVTGTFTISFPEFQLFPKPKNYRAFFITRDPRDIVISAYFSNRYSHSVMDHIACTREILEALPLEDGLIYTVEILQHVFEVMDSWVDAHSQDPNVKLYKYEDLIGQDSAALFMDLFHHCEIPFDDSTVTEILEDYRFENLARGRKQDESDKKSHYRKGKSGDWKNYFTPHVYERFQEISKNITDKLGYSWQDFTPLTTKPELEKTNDGIANHASSSRLPQTNLQLGRIEFEKGVPDKALHYLDLVIDDLLPIMAEAQFYRGVINFRSANLDEAIQSFRFSLEQGSQFLDAWFYLGRSYHIQGNLQEAISSYEEFLKFKPQSADTHFYLANIYTQTDNQGLSEQHYEDSIRLKPKFLDAHFYLGNLYYHQNKLLNAMNCYRKCLEINPNFSGAYFYIGEILIKRGQFKEAILFHKKFRALRDAVEAKNLQT